MRDAEADEASKAGTKMLAR